MVHPVPADLKNDTLVSLVCISGEAPNGHRMHGTLDHDFFIFHYVF